jgi:nicotinate phosphoribosyltransferase
MTDFSKRAYDHSYNIDPIVRSLLDTDFYKLLMLQFIWKNYRNIPVTFSLINRSKTIKLGNIISYQELREQLEHVTSLRFTENELIWLHGNTFYGVKNIFKSEFIQFLRDLRLTMPNIMVNKETGELEVHATGCWSETTLWEIYIMTIVNTLRNRKGMKGMSKFDLKRLYNEAEHRLFAKLDHMSGNNVTGLADFGTRRRHDFMWHEFCVEACMEIMKGGFIGTSNAYIAMKLGISAIGTNAHELPMVVACLAETDEELKQAQYEVIRQWQELYDGNLRVILPDTFGTTQFFENAPEWIADSTGVRLDSKNPFVGGEEAIDFFRKWDRDPMSKLLLPSDGLDAGPIVSLNKHFTGKVGRIGYGLGTMLTNDFPTPITPISIVCKVTEANGKSAVKLSDNFLKATGTKEAIEHYRRVFGTKGVENAPVLV